jgi:hypothetical protein
MDAISSSPPHSIFHGGETLLKLLRIAQDYDWMAMRAAAIELQQADELARPFGENAA